MVKIDIEMPKNCQQCRFKKISTELRPYCNILPSGKSGYSNDLSYWKYTGIDASERHEKCPLIDCSPVKPNDNCCPKCSTYLKDDNGVEGDYCPNCGQAIDWEGNHND